MQTKLEVIIPVGIEIRDGDSKLDVVFPAGIHVQRNQLAPHVDLVHLDPSRKLLVGNKDGEIDCLPHTQHMPASRISWLHLQVYLFCYPLELVVTQLHRCYMDSKVDKMSYHQDVHDESKLSIKDVRDIKNMA